MGYNVKVDELENFVIVDCEIKKEINTHGKVAIKGYIQREFNDQFKRVIETNEYFTVRALNADEKSKVVFCGILSLYQIKHMQDFDEAYVEFVAATERMDKVEQKRVFSNDSELYENVINYVNIYTDRYFNTSDVKGNMGRLSIQYLETDWEYLKRLAAEKNSFVVPEFEQDGGGFWIGIPDGEKVSVESVEYKKTIDYLEHMRKEKNNIDTTLVDENVYIFNSREILKIGTRITKENRELIIYKSYAKLVGANLVTTYYIKSPKGLKTIPYKNLKIIGASITAKVNKVVGDKLEVKMLLDGLQDNPKKMEFATIYSSTGDAGWYCMPEEKDIVRVYFPNENEDEAFVFNAMQIDKAGKKPEIKFFRNPHGKEIEFAESYIKITNNDGLSIILDDDDGIKIENERDTKIKIVANNNLELEGENGSVEIIAEESISLRKEESVIVLDEDVTLIGKQVHVKEI